MLESDFNELLEEYISSTISDKDFLTLVSAASSNPKWKQKFDEAEKMLEMSSSSFIDKSRRRFKTKFREYIETQKSKMRSIQNRNSFLTKSLIYIFAGVIITAVSLYFELFIKKTTFGMMIVLFQIISIVIILTIGVYVFFFRGKD
jgi:hypothetical protein